MNTTTIEPKLAERAITTIRMLAVDAVEKANSGHPGTPMGLADCAFELWLGVMNFCPGDPHWPNRDRFILSAGHASMLLYAMLHLSGYDLTLDDLKQFRQWGSKTPGHPELHHTPGVETTTGPLGQGFGNAVGIAIAQKMMATRFNRDDFAVFDHHVYGFASDGDMMEGVSSEAASIAGHLGLDNLIFIYDDNHITIDGKTSLTFSEDVGARFEAYHWFVQHIDGHDHDQIRGALSRARAERARPSMIVAGTHIGYGAPTLQDSEKAHGAPLGAAEVKALRAKWNWPAETFFVPPEVRDLFAARRREVDAAHDAWQRGFEQWRARHPDLAAQLEAHRQKMVPVHLQEELLAAVPKEAEATRALSSKILQRAAALVPSLVGGAADLNNSTKTDISGAGSIERQSFGGRNLHFGVREHAMGGILSGLALHEGFLPLGSTFLVFSDYMRPSIRLASLMGLQVFYVFTHDSIFVGEDGPTHEPIEHLAALRAIPNLTVFRPADGVEAAMAWTFALNHRSGPTAFILTRQKVPLIERAPGFDPAVVLQGGYVVNEVERARLTLVATGSEVGLAIAASKLLREQNVLARVVSMPCPELFRAQDDAVRARILPRSIPVVTVEAGVTRDWAWLTEPAGLAIGMDRYGASAPAPVLAEKFGFTPPQVAERISSWLNRA
jgi:transketolase